MQFAYVLLFWATLTEGYSIFNEPPNAANYIWLSNVAAIFGYNPLFYVGSVVLCLIAAGLTAIFPEKLPLRLLTFLLFTLVVCNQFTFEMHVNMLGHAWVIVSFALCFWSRRLERQAQVLRVIQVLLLAHYFMSGLWKVRYLAKNLIDHPAGAVIYSTVFDPIAECIFEGNFIRPELIEALVHHPGFATLGWISVIAFQIFAFVPVTQPRYVRTWGIMAVAFHVTIGLVMGIWFTSTMLAALYFLDVVPDVIGLKTQP